jgi:hypothetical protein
MATRRLAVKGAELIWAEEFSSSWSCSAIGNSIVAPAAFGQGEAMKIDSPPKPGTRAQKLRMRFFWFLAGAGLNYLLISTPFRWLDARFETQTALHVWAISACSIGVATTFFFVWNYFINFRTDSRKRDALARYVTAVALMWVLSSTMLTVLKHFDARMALQLAGAAIDLDIVATQFFLAGLKFTLYHKWVFPLEKSDDKRAAVEVHQAESPG